MVSKRADRKLLPLIGVNGLKYQYSIEYNTIQLCDANILQEKSTLGRDTELNKQVYWFANANITKSI